MSWRRNRVAALGALVALGASLVACDGGSSADSDQATSPSGDERSASDDATAEGGPPDGEDDDADGADAEGSAGSGRDGDAEGGDPEADDGDGGDGAGESTTGEEPPPLHAEVDDWPATTVEVTSGDTTHEVAARVAATPEHRRRGLQHVEEVPEGAGMLFLFEDEQDSGFWMKDTLVPLDIAFVDGEGRIVEVLTMEPCRSDPCPTYEPDGAYRSALEVPADWLVERGVGAGDRVVWDEAAAGR